MKSFRHRPVSNDPTDVIDETEDGCGNDQGSQTKKKKRGPTKLRRPPNGQQIRIKPVGEEQSESVNEGDEEQMSIGGQITTILKLEYPSIIEETPKKTFYARTWAHYAITEDDEGMTAADRFRKEFWSIYSVDEGDRLHAEEVLERFAAKQCRNMMYELRVTAVKDYYDNIKQPITDPVARNILLREAQYLKVKPEWISEGAWCKICAYWCSVEFLRKRRFAQKSRLQPDFTQNRGGSRPHSQTKQFLGRTYGLEAATDINTYCCMKSGVKNCDSNGKSGPIPTEKVRRRVDDYFGKKVDAKVVYQSSGNGLAHGRVPIANGAVRKCEVKASGRASSMTRQSNSWSYQYLLRRNARLEKGYKIGLVFCKHMPDLFAKMNMPVQRRPPEAPVRSGVLQRANNVKRAYPN